MEQLDRARLSSVILSAPAWARVGIATRDERMRERAADVLAATIAERLNVPEPPDRNQLTLELEG